MPAHKTACEAVASITKDYEAAATASPPVDMAHFVHLYMRQLSPRWPEGPQDPIQRYRPLSPTGSRRLRLVAALGEIEPRTHFVGRKQLDHLLELIDDKEDPYWVHGQYLLPALALRLGRNEMVIDHVMGVPYTNTMKAKAPKLDVESVLSPICSGAALQKIHQSTGEATKGQNTVALALVMIRVLLDLQRIRATVEAIDGRLPIELVEKICTDVPLTSLVAENDNLVYLSPAQLHASIERATLHARALCRSVSQSWDAMLTFSKRIKPPNYLTDTFEMSLYYVVRAWEETPGALECYQGLKYKEMQLPDKRGA